eukprot:368072_1
MSSLSITSILERLSVKSLDRDFKWMAMEDMYGELNNTVVRLEPGLETRVCESLLSQLLSPAVELQDLALKCISRAVLVFRAETLSNLCVELTSQLLQHCTVTTPNGTTTDTCLAIVANDRDTVDHSTRVASALSRALQCVFKDTRGADWVVDLAVKKALTGLLDALEAELSKSSSSASDPRASFILDVLDSLFRAHGGAVEWAHAAAVTRLAPLTSSADKERTRKANECLASLAPALSAESRKSLIKALLSDFKVYSAKRDSTSSVNVLRSLCGIVRTCGPLLNDDLSDIVQCILAVCQASFENDKNCELLEHCFITLERLIHSCPDRIIPLFPEMLGPILQSIGYDPNVVEYTACHSDQAMSEAGESDSWGEEGASCSEGDGVSESGEESECEDIESEADMGDDEDQSWKVRRASVKCILTMLSTIHNSRSGKYKNFYKRITDTFYKEVVPVLISRFSEREEKIKLDIFAAFVEVLRQADDNNILLDHTAFSRDVFSKLGCGFQHKSAAIRTSSLNLAKSTIKICGIAEDDRNFLCEYSLIRHLKVPDRVTDARTRVSALQCFIVLLEKTHTFLDVLDVEGLWHCSTILLLCEQSDVIIHALQVIQKLHEYHSRSDNALPEPSSMDCCVDIGSACSNMLQEDNMEQIVINSVLSCLVTLANTPTVSVWIFKTLAHLLPLDNKQTRILTVKLIREILINTDRDGDEKSDSNVAIPDEFITYIPSFLRQASDSLKEASVSCLCAMVDFGVKKITQADVIGPILEDVWRLLRAPDDST